VKIRLSLLPHCQRRHSDCGLNARSIGLGLCLFVASFCEALSHTFRTELKRRVAGQQAAESTALGETIAAAFRRVLSLQKAGKPKDGPAMAVVSALNAINNKLAAAGLDLNNITGVNIDPAATKRKAA
jgi:hypothetical protein